MHLMQHEHKYMVFFFLFLVLACCFDCYCCTWRIQHKRTLKQWCPLWKRKSLYCKSGLVLHSLLGGYCKYWKKKKKRKKKPCTNQIKNKQTNKIVFYSVGVKRCFTCWDFLYVANKYRMQTLKAVITWCVCPVLTVVMTMQELSMLQSACFNIYTKPIHLGGKKIWKCFKCICHGRLQPDCIQTAQNNRKRSFTTRGVRLK